MRDNIKFSGQIGDYVIHGAIEKIKELCSIHDVDLEAKLATGSVAAPKEGPVERLIDQISEVDQLRTDKEILSQALEVADHNLKEAIKCIDLIEECWISPESRYWGSETNDMAEEIKRKFPKALLDKP